MQNGHRHSARVHELLRLRGPLGATEICAALAVSQPTFSRVVRSDPMVLKVGKARASRYLLRRDVPGVRQPISVYEVGEGPRERPRRLLVLHPVWPAGVWVEAIAADVKEQLFDDLPWFLEPMRPAGFLGRLVPRILQEPDLPNDIHHWTSDQTLRYLAGWGWDLPGSLIVGDRALQRFVQYAAAPDLVSSEDRPVRYVELAEEVLSRGVPGSSAAGEQPKFLATKERDGRGVPVIVKFSPPRFSELARRIADLLVCEHLVHSVLPGYGQECASSELLFAGDRVFLEVERFDRLGTGHRRGVTSLYALDSEFVGRMLSWTDTSRALLRDGLIDMATDRDLRWRAAFGELIGNSDMHLGNASLFMKGVSVRGLAPVYDMLPMFFAPRDNQLVDTELELPLPRPEDADVWPAARAAAHELWVRVADDQRVSPGFRAIASTMATRVAAMERFVELLPLA